MTIAAGFVHRDGVLLCADTHHEGYDLKLQSPKHRYFECKFGRVCMVYAGNSAYAITVSQKIERKLKTLPVENPLPTIEKIIDREYRRLVMTHPHFGQDSTLDYGFLLAIQTTGKPVKLYTADQITVRQVDMDGYRCIGSGETFGTQLLKPIFARESDPSRVLVLALYVLALVKANVSGCGGMSLFVDLRHDGTMRIYGGDPFLDRLEKWFQSFASFSWQLLNAFTDIDVNDVQFNQSLELFGVRMTEARRALAARGESR